MCRYNLRTSERVIRRALEHSASCVASTPVVHLDTASLKPFLASLEPFRLQNATASPACALPSPAAQGALIDASMHSAHLLPAALLDAVKHIYRANSSPSVLISGVPVPAQVPEVTSPLLDLLPSSTAHVFLDTLAVQAAIGSLTGNQYTFAGERGDNLFQLVVPVGDVPADSQSSVGSSSINFHTEDPIPPIEAMQPRALSLLMVRPCASHSNDSEGVQTLLSAIDDIASDLLTIHGDIIATLASPRFTHPMPDVFSIMGKDSAGVAGIPPKAAPILYVRNDDDSGVGVPAILLQEYTHAADPNDTMARNAVKTLRTLLLCHSTRHALGAGDMLIWANQRAAHGRAGVIAPALHGFDRLLVRTFHHPSPPALVVV